MWKENVLPLVKRSKIALKNLNIDLRRRCAWPKIFEYLNSCKQYINLLVKFSISSFSINRDLRVYTDIQGYINSSRVA